MPATGGRHRRSGAGGADRSWTDQASARFDAPALGWFTEEGHVTPRGRLVGSTEPRGERRAIARAFSPGLSVGRSPMRSKRAPATPGNIDRLRRRRLDGCHTQCRRPPPGARVFGAAAAPGCGGISPTGTNYLRTTCVRVAFRRKIPPQWVAFRRIQWVAFRRTILQRWGTGFVGLIRGLVGWSSSLPNGSR